MLSKSVTIKNANLFCHSDGRTNEMNKRASTKKHRAERLKLRERKMRTDVNKEELNYLYTSTHINWVIKSRRLRYTEHAARMGGMRKCWPEEHLRD